MADVAVGGGREQQVLVLLSHSQGWLGTSCLMGCHLLCPAH